MNYLSLSIKAFQYSTIWHLPVKFSYNLSKITLIILCLFFASSVFNQSEAQDRIQILNAGTMEGIREGDENIRILQTNVRLQTPKFLITCDSAYQIINKQEIFAYGNIEIETDNEMIWSDTAHYQSAKEYSTLSGRVVLWQDSLTLYGSRIEYNFDSKKAYFPDRFLLDDDEGQLSSTRGNYWEESDSLSLTRQVQVFDSLQYIEADTLLGNRRSENYEFYGRVYAENKEKRVTLTSQSMFADSTGRRLLRGNATMEKVTAGTEDTTFIQAKEIELLEDTDTTYVVNARGDVNIWNPNYSAIADTSHYYSGEELFQLRSDPITWNEQIQLTAPKIDVHLNNDSLEKLRAFPKPFIVKNDTVIDRKNQITGDSLTVYFTNGDIDELVVYPNSHLLYFSKNEKDQSDGAMEMRAAKTILHFQNGDIQKMKGTQTVDGSYLPENEEVAKKQLDGFEWQPELRPEKPTGLPDQKWPDSLRKKPIEPPSAFMEFLQPQKSL